MDSFTVPCEPMALLKLYPSVRMALSFTVYTPSSARLIDLILILLLAASFVMKGKDACVEASQAPPAF